MEMFKKMATECATKEGASSADLDEVFAKKMPSTEPAKCLHACIGETMGIVSHFVDENDSEAQNQNQTKLNSIFQFIWPQKMKDNQINVDGVVAMAKMAFDDDAAKLQTARDIAADCVGVTDGHRCQAALKMLECSVNAHKTRGLQFGEW